MYSRFLKDRQPLCQELLNELLKEYDYVSILGKHVTGRTMNVNNYTTYVGDPFDAQCGFVVKLHNGKTYSEYSFSDITADTISSIREEIKKSVDLSSSLLDNHVEAKVMTDEPLIKDFSRPNEGKEISPEEGIKKLTELKDSMLKVSDKLIQVGLNESQTNVSSMFLSKNRQLTQYYSWSAVQCFAVSRDGDKIQQAYDVSAYNNLEKCYEEAKVKCIDVANLAVELLGASMIEPGEYDIITAPSITGLIAHEAFGHGVEMDMFVKKRAKSRNYVGKPVASELVEMHDGAAATLSAASYFFDDDGVLAHDTLIIKEGILQTGISDAVSAMQLGTEPTGNGRRQAPDHKAYTRMTNTFFSAGDSNKDDMIASIKHGYMLFQTNNGMEDPKNWNIQCVAQYGREIKDGKFTGKVVAPVVMSGYVPDLLMSISAVSKEWEVIGSGYCGKGYKEWVPVSDGGPYLKARCKLG